MTSVKSWLTFVMIVLTLGISLTANAQTESEKKQAKEHFEKASRLYELQKYGEAIAEYESAYLLVEDPALLFNIGQAYRLWEKPEDAIRSYKNYLRRRPDAANRADVEKKIVDLENQIEEKRAAMAPATAPAAIALPQEAPPPIAPPANVPNSPSITKPIAPANPIARQPEPNGITPPSEVLSTPDKPASTAPKRWLPYTLMGIGGVGLLSAIVAGSIGSQKANKLANASKSGAIYDPAVAANGKTANGVAAISVLVGLAAGGTGVYFYRQMKKQDASSSASLFPVISSNYAGGVAHVAF